LHFYRIFSLVNKDCQYSGNITGHRLIQTWRFRLVSAGTCLNIHVW